MSLLPWLLATTLLGASTPPLPFHTELQATYPAADSVHASEIREIRLRFSTAVQLELSTVTVLGPGGVLRDADSLRYVAGSEDRELHLPLAAPLANGAYRVEWRTAGPDGHALRGDFAFEVQRPVQPDTAPPAAATQEPAGAAPGAGVLTQVADGGGEAASGGRSTGALARWLLYLAMTAGLGGAVFLGAVLPRLGTESEAMAVRGAVAARASVLGWVGVAAGLVALPLTLGVQSVQTFGTEGLAPASLIRVVGSSWGGSWMAQVAGVALLAVGLLLARGTAKRWGWLAAGAAGLVLAVGLASAGHAAEGGAFTVAVQTLHAVAAATWLGGLVLLAMAVLPATRNARAYLSRTVDAFSPLALGAVGVLVATGALNNWDRLGGIGPLFTTTFGRVLLLKLALFAGAAAMGFYNWRTVRPALRQEPRAGLLRMPVTLEMVLGLVVLVVTAFLVALPLP